MRENKFRVWYIKEKKYLTEGLNQICLMPDGRVMWFSYAGLEDVTGKFIIEQTTGLKDENGKEIYEGDIVISGLIKTVVSMEDAKVITRSGHGDSSHSMYIYLFGGYGWDCVAEVAGNINENPELLEEGK